MSESMAHVVQKCCSDMFNRTYGNSNELYPEASADRENNNRHETPRKTQVYSSPGSRVVSDTSFDQKVDIEVVSPAREILSPTMRQKRFAQFRRTDGAAMRSTRRIHEGNSSTRSPMTSNNIAPSAQAQAFDSEFATVVGTLAMLLKQFRQHALIPSHVHERRSATRLECHRHHSINILVLSESGVSIVALLAPVVRSHGCLNRRQELSVYF